MTHATDKTINALAGIAYSYAIELHEASIKADYDELEHIARKITERLKAKLHAALEGHQAATPGAEPLVRYCPGCGIVGPVEGEYLDCCPDGNEARMIPEALARKCHDTFRLAVDGAILEQGDALDAARYRWLREQQWNESHLFVVSGGKLQVKLGTNCPSLDGLDATIDAALAALPAKGGA